MDPNKAEEGSGKHNAENPLPRGLEQVSHLFLSQAQPIRAIPESPEPSPGNRGTPRPGDPSLTVVLRPCRFLAREQLVSLLRKQTGVPVEKADRRTRNRNESDRRQHSL